MPLEALFDIKKGTIGAAQAESSGSFPFITSSEEIKFHSQYSFDNEAICIPIVSATGHGHASIKTIHYVSGKFSAATITAVMTRKPGIEIYIPYVYFYLLAHKDELLVPLMRGAANVSLNLNRLGRLHIPVPLNIDEQKAIVDPLINAKKGVLQLKTSLKDAEKKLREKMLDFYEKS
jgi:restriction endonuclease S subunit